MLDRQDFVLLDLIRKNMRIYWSESKVPNINQKLQKHTFLLSKLKSELKKIIKISWFLFSY